jgi:signal transduction histidine kinase
MIKDTKNPVGNMDAETLEAFRTISTEVFKADWKESLESLYLGLRKVFIFDNLVIYLADNSNHVPEPVFARAVGRARSKEAEAAWGEEIANKVINSEKIIHSEPSGITSADRAALPYMLGIPFTLPFGKGAVVFVRFGGPQYTCDQIPLAILAAAQTARVFEHRKMDENLMQLELSSQRAQFQDDFIATISHELHTPLGFIKGYTTSLLRQDTRWDPDTQKEFLTIIDEESDHLIRLVDHILDSARLQSGNIHMDFQPVRLDSLLRDVVTRVLNRNKSLKVEINAGPTPPIKADIVRLTQVFDNLFNNALKYAEGSKITISLTVNPENQVVSFADEGPGIPTEYLPHIFERFYRVPGHPNLRGTGLGLFICKQIIQAHNGSISVQTSPGKGTRFLIELPVKNRKTGRKG